MPKDAGMKLPDPRAPVVLCRLIGFALSSWHCVLLAALLGFATVGSSIGLMGTSAFVVAKAALQPSIADLQVAIVGVRFFGIARGLFRYLERNLSHDLNFRLLARLRVWFYGKLEPLAPARLMEYHSGDLLSRILADIDTLENLYARVIAPPLVALLVCLLVGVWSWGIAPVLSGLVLGALALAGGVLPMVTQWLGKRPGARMVQVRSALNSAIVDGIQGAADLLAYGRESRQMSRTRQLGEQLAESQDRMARIAGMHDAAGGLLMHLAVVATLLVVIPLVRSAGLDGVTLAVSVLVVMASFEAVQPLPQAFQYLGQNLAAGQRLYEIVDSEPAVRDVAGASVPSYCQSGDSPELEIRDLTFRYAIGEPPALDGVSLTIPSGECVAVVGPSGAGKSTLVNLLLRFWDYDRGRILVGNHELRSYRPDQIGGLIGVVSQRTHLFSATVWDNLLLARPEASRDQIIRAAERAQIHQMILSLPDGYQTWIGDQGIRLSGGERQRLAIARAILQDTPILVLDEATANLDPITERAVMAELRELMEGRTTLIITHRLVGLETAHLILVLKNGRIAERGRHHELIELGGVYRGMWSLQNQEAWALAGEGLDISGELW